MRRRADLAALDRRYRDQATWTRELRLRLLADAGVGPGSRLLDVGAGTGAVADDILRTYPGTQLIALDVDAASLAHARTRVDALACVTADAHALPFGPSSFDMSFFHFVLLWLEHPVDALKEAARVTRRQGRVAAFAEPDHAARIDAPVELELLGRRQTEALAWQGADTRLGRKLRGAFEAAGLEAVRCGILGGEWTRATVAGSAVMEWSVLRADLEETLSREELDRLEAADRLAWAEGVRVLFVPTFYAIGRVP